MSAADLERLILDAWPARERATLHGWTLLADAGVTGRVNAVAPLSYDGADLDAAITTAVTWQTARGNRPCFKIADGACAPSTLQDALTAKGWSPQTPTLVMTAQIDEALPALTTSNPWIPERACGASGMTKRVVGGIQLTPDLLPAIDAIIAETATSEAEYAERRGIAARTPQPRRFAMLERDGAAAATGLTVLTEGWAAIFLMRTHPVHRRQGMARDILAALLRWAQDAGAAHAYLQVEASNGPAIALYESAAFETAYSYAYWRPETTT